MVTYFFLYYYVYFLLCLNTHVIRTSGLTVNIFKSMDRTALICRYDLHVLIQLDT